MHTDASRQLPPHETLGAGLLLSCVGGYLEAYTFLLRGGVFCNAQTGNLALMVLNFVRGDVHTAMYYPIPVLAFFVGVLLAVYLRKHMRGERRYAWVSAMIFLEMALLFLVGLVPLDAPNAYANVTVSFLCAMQFEAFKQARGVPYASTFCTGNLRLAAEQTYAYFQHRDAQAGKSALIYLGMILAFAAGVLAGALVCEPLGARAAWLPILALAALLWMQRMPEASGAC